MISAKEALASQMEAKLNHHLLQFEQVKRHVTEIGLEETPSFQGATRLVEARADEIRFNLRYLRNHKTVILEKIIRMHVMGLLADLNSLVFELAHQYKY
jgi:hypothetical protein